MTHFILDRKHTGLMVIDVQERLFNQIERPCEVLQAMQQVIEGFKILQIPIIVTEQYPQGLGPTIGALKSCLGDAQEYLPKTSFSCLGEPAILSRIRSLPVTQWVLIGIEAHVCVLQSAKSLQSEHRDVVVLNDAISSRSIYNFSTAIAEMRDSGVRVSCVETVLFELLCHSRDTAFKQISQLIK